MTRRFPKRPSPSTSPESLVDRVDQQRPGDVPGDTVPTGFPSIDRILGGGLRRRDLPLTTVPLAAPDFETAAERLDALRQLGLVVIDYLQLVPSPRGVTRSTQDEDLALVLQRLKALALERRVALVVVSQLPRFDAKRPNARRSEEHTSELQSPCNLVCRLLLEKKKTQSHSYTPHPPSSPSPCHPPTTQHP